MVAQFEISPWLREQRDEIVAAVQSRIEAIEGSKSVDDLTYQDGLRRTVVAAVDFGLEALGSTAPPQPPPELFSQVRLAARHDVPFATVVHRYVAGNQILGDYLVEVARGQKLPFEALQDLFRRQACAFEGVIATLGTEYAQELETCSHSLNDRRLALVKRLLAAERVDPAPLQFEFGDWNLALIAGGEEAVAKVRAIAAPFDRRLLLVEPGSGQAWAWLGGRREFSEEEIARLLSACSAVTCAIGEPNRGLGGWRFSHCQARAAIAVAELRRKPTRYRNVALEAAVLQDAVLAQSLQTLWLEPLAGDRDGGAALRQTLCAYFSTGRNLSSSAAKLGVSRQTVANRLRIVETKIGTQLDAVGLELEVALRAERLLPG